MQAGGVGDRTKNLLNNILNTQTKNGVTFTVNENKSVTCNGKNQNENQGLFITIGDYSATNDVILSGGVSGGNLNSYVLRAYTLTDNPVIYYDEGDGVTLPAGNDYRIQIRIAGDYTCNNLTFYPMIRLATIEDNLYEPFGYKVPVMVEGKNLLDEANAVVTDYYLTNAGQEAVGANGDRFLKSYINVNPSTKYTFKWSQTIMGYSNNTPYIRISEYTSNNTFIQRLLCQCSAQSQNNYTFTTSNNTLYIDIRIDSETSTRGQHITEVMLVKGATAPDTYEEYTATTTNIYLDEPIEAKANIPSEYTEVEYIESTGTQYIDTNYTPVQGDDLEFKNVTINTFNGALFSAGTESYQLILLGLGSVCYYKYFQTGNAAASSFSTITNGNIKVLNGNLYINNVLKAQADYGGAVNTTLNIFQRANNTSNLIGKIGEIIISNNGIIKRDFIPCYRNSDNVAGLYDLVNNVFYTNQGTGNFIVGPIKENESVSLSDTNINIPTFKGTNVLTVDTTVQPSKVYVKSRKESQYETAMREDYEEQLSDIESALQEV